MFLIYSKGKNIELYLAEEAIGLGKSMEWEIVPGPFDKKDDFADCIFKSIINNFFLFVNKSCLIK